MHYRETENDLDRSEEEMANKKPWERPMEHRGETEDGWNAKYPLHSVVEHANRDWFDTSTELDEEMAIRAFRKGANLLDKDAEGYTVLDYVQHNPSAEAVMTRLFAAISVERLAQAEADEFALVTLPASGPSRKFRF